MSLTAAAVSSVFTLVVQSTEDQKTTTSELSPGQSATPGSATTGGPDAWNYARNLSGYFGAVAVGSKSINIVYSDGGATAQAVNTLTFSGALSNNDTLTIQGVVITFKTSGATGSQVNLGGSQANTMTNLVTFINQGGSSANIAGVCSALQTGTNTIKLTAIPPGIVGNTITLAKSAANLAITGATFAGGAATTQAGPISIGI